MKDAATATGSSPHHSTTATGRSRVKGLSESLDVENLVRSDVLETLESTALAVTVAVLSRKDIEVSTDLLGRGAFGEVFAARWRGVSVAYKRLHVVNDEEAHIPSESTGTSFLVTGDGSHRPLIFTQGSPIGQPFDENRLPHLSSAWLREISLLAQLRHPNLVLFLGVCCEGSGTRSSNGLALVTERLLCSLYDLLETPSQPYKLRLSDILEISRDVANALCYLHNQENAIVHRDVSAKNVLIAAGGRAKLADFGQAKSTAPIGGANALSRQTTMPGSLAYSAPEVLTGRYGAPVDVFSFGVLLAQMSSGEYPRVDRREAQIALAVEVQPVLANLIEKCLSYQPSERPTSDDVVKSLSILLSNDRYYPAADMVASQQLGVSLLARQWVEETVKQRCATSLANEERLQNQLSAEERRWNEEASKVDGLLETIKTQQQAITAQRVGIEKLEDRLAVSMQTVKETEERESLLQSQLQSARREIERLQQSLQTTEAMSSIHKKELSDLRGRFLARETELTQSIQEATQSRESESALQSNLNLLHRQVRSQAEYVRELEGRIEQTLANWREEKSRTNTEKIRVTKLTGMVSKLSSEKEKLEEDLAFASNKLAQYEDLPMATEIMARFASLQESIAANREVAEKTTAEKTAVEEQRAAAEAVNEELRAQIDDLLSKLASRDNELSIGRIDALAISEQLKASERRVEELETRQNALVKENDALGHGMDRLNVMVDRLKSQLKDRVAQIERLEEVINVSGGPSVLQSISVSSTSDVPPVLSAVSEAVTENEIDVDVPPERISDIGIKHLITRTTSEGGVNGLIALTQQYAYDDRIVWRAVRALRELLLYDEEHRKACESSSPEDWLVDLLKKYPTSPMILGQAARLLGTVAYGNDVFRRKAGEQHVFRWICRALQMHGTDETITLHCSTAITNLCHGSAENRSRFMEIGGVPILLSAMKEFQQNPRIQRQCCWAILSLSASDDIANVIVREGGVELIFSAMTQLGHESGVQQYGFWALNNLALASESIADLLRRKGVVQLCETALRNHADNEEVIRQARNTLGVFSKRSPSNSKASDSIRSKYLRKNQQR